MRLRLSLSRSPSVCSAQFLRGLLRALECKEIYIHTYICDVFEPTVAKLPSHRVQQVDLTQVWEKHALAL